MEVLRGGTTLSNALEVVSAQYIGKQALSLAKTWE